MGNIFRKKKVAENDKHQDINDNDSFVEICIDDYRPLNDHLKDLSVADQLSEKDPNIKLLISRWREEQLELKNKNILTETDDFMETLKYIGGMDISFPADKEDLVHACACLVVVSYPELEIVYKKLQTVHLTSVYIPEYLAFREVEPLKEMCNELMKNEPQYYPQLVLVDGNGILHPKKFGIACHLGVQLDIATIGVAKKLFHVDGLEKNQDFKTRKKTLHSKGDTLELMGVSRDIYGKALKSTEKSTNPIYVSIGHKISLDLAVDIVCKCCIARVPEPIRWADILSREYIRENYASHVETCQSYAELNSYFLSLSKLIH